MAMVVWPICGLIVISSFSSRARKKRQFDVNLSVNTLQCMMSNQFAQVRTIGRKTNETLLKLYINLGKLQKKSSSVSRMLAWAKVSRLLTGALSTGFCHDRLQECNLSYLY